MLSQNPIFPSQRFGVIYHVTTGHFISYNWHYNDLNIFNQVSVYLPLPHTESIDERLKIPDKTEASARLVTEIFLETSSTLIKFKNISHCYEILNETKVGSVPRSLLTSQKQPTSSITSTLLSQQHFWLYLLWMPPGCFRL